MEQFNWEAVENVMLITELIQAAWETDFPKPDGSVD